MQISQEHPFVRGMNAFLYSPAYVAFMGVLVVLSNVFCMELFSYTVMILFGIYICLFSKDLLPLLPPFAMDYTSPSLNNNPGFNDNSVFSISGSGPYLAFMLMLFLISLVYRLVTDPHFGGKQFLLKKRKLLPGMLLLSATYALSGLGSGQWREYGWRNLFFAFLQFASLVLLYYLFSGGVRWETAPKAYLFWLGTTFGYVLLAELINIYITCDVLYEGTLILRENIATGWGHYNNIGVMIAMVIPLTFFLTGKGRLAWFAYLSGILFYIGLIFTCSRGSILVGTVIFAASYLLSLIHSRHARRQFVIHIGLICFGLLVAGRYYEKLLDTFAYVIRYGLRSALRLQYYAEGIKQFLQFPVFGGSFFPVDFAPDSYAQSQFFQSVFPPRWHNTVVQLLASGGIVCLGAYVYHRVQTVKLFIRNFSREKLFAGFSILAMLLCSMVDCHFFNIGPVMFYSIILAVVEFGLEKQ